MVKINAVINKINANLNSYLESQNSNESVLKQNLNRIFINDSDFGISQFKLLFKLISNADFFIEDENISNLITYNIDLTKSIPKLTKTIELLNDVIGVYTTNLGGTSTNSKVVAFEVIIGSPSVINDQYIDQFLDRM